MRFSLLFSAQEACFLFLSIDGDTGDYAPPAWPARAGRAQASQWRAGGLCRDDGAPALAESDTFVSTQRRLVQSILVICDNQQSYHHHHPAEPAEPGGKVALTSSSVASVLAGVRF